MKAKRISFVIILMLICVLLTACSTPESTYKQAQNLLSQGKYTQAAEKFESLGSYEDAATLAMYCKACALCEAGNFETGITALEKLGEYKDCAYRITYYTARSWDDGSVDTREFEWMEHAQSIYNENPLYLDSAERIAALDKRIESTKKQTYNDAVAMAEKGQYDDAIDILWHMGDYEDSWERVGYYRLREQEDALATSTDHDALLTLATDYSSWGEYLDCAKRAEALTKMANSLMEEKYKVAIDLMNAGNDTEAYRVFISLNNYKDCTARAKSLVSSISRTTSAKGFLSDVKVTAAFFENGTIATLVVDVSGETMGFGTRCAEDETFLDQFIGKAGPFEDVEVVSGATVTSYAVIEAVNSLFAAEEAAPAGETASAKGLLSEVKVTITKNEDGTIATMTVDASGETEAIAKPCTEDAFLSQFIGKKGPFDDVDVVAGATFTSNAVINAVNNLFPHK